MYPKEVEVRSFASGASTFLAFTGLDTGAALHVIYHILILLDKVNLYGGPVGQSARGRKGMI